MRGVHGIDCSKNHYRVSTSRGEFDCSKIVIAAGAWCVPIARMLGITLPVRCAPQQMLVTQAVEKRIPYLLSLAGRHLTMKQTANGNLLIGGGWPAEIDAASERGIVLRDSIEGNLWTALRALPQLASAQVIRSWAAMGVMIDGAPIIDTLPGHSQVAVAVGANGYTMGPAMGRLVSDILANKDAALDLAPFSISRFDA